MLGGDFCTFEKQGSTKGPKQKPKRERGYLTRERFKEEIESFQGGEKLAGETSLQKRDSVRVKGVLKRLPIEAKAILCPILWGG